MDRPNPKLPNVLAFAWNNDYKNIFHFMVKIPAHNRRGPEGPFSVPECLIEGWGEVREGVGRLTYCGAVLLGPYAQIYWDADATSHRTQGLCVAHDSASWMRTGQLVSPTLEDFINRWCQSTLEVFAQPDGHRLDYYGFRVTTGSILPTFNQRHMQRLKGLKRTGYYYDSDGNAAPNPYDHDNDPDEDDLF